MAKPVDWDAHAEGSSPYVAFTPTPSNKLQRAVQAQSSEEAIRNNPLEQARRVQ
jgi:hypothetical protein